MNEPIRLSVSQGEKIVIEGESGKGKSTLMKVVAGLYAPTKGTILYKDPLSISYVPQELSIFTRTLLENIRMGNGCAGKQAIEEAAKKPVCTNGSKACPMAMIRILTCLESKTFRKDKCRESRSQERF